MNKCKTCRMQFIEEINNEFNVQNNENNENKKHYLFTIPNYANINDKTKYKVGFQLNKNNFWRVPSGEIKIISYVTSFNIDYGRGYAIDYLLRIGIKRWKKKHIEKNRYKMLIILLKSMIYNKLPFDVIKTITKNNYL